MTRRALVYAAAFLLFHLLGLHAMESWRVMEVLLSPGSQEPGRLFLALLFLCTRLAAFFLAPGLLCLAAWGALRRFQKAGQRPGTAPSP